MNSDRIHKQIRSLLTRWGYKPIEGDIKDSGNPLGLLAKQKRDQFPGCIWGKDDEEILVCPSGVPDFVDRVADMVGILSYLHDFSTNDIRRMIEAEPVDRNLGTIELHPHPQPLTEWGDREDHAEAMIVLDAHGRDRLIAALIEGSDSIEVYGKSGGGYMLKLSLFPCSSAAKIASISVCSDSSIDIGNWCQEQ